MKTPSIAVKKRQKALQTILDNRSENGCSIIENFVDALTKLGFKTSNPTTSRDLSDMGYVSVTFTGENGENITDWLKRTKTKMEIKQDTLIEDLNEKALYATEISSKIFSFAIKTKRGYEEKIAQLISESFNKTATFAIPCVRYVLVFSYKKANIKGVYDLIEKSGIEIKAKTTNEAVEETTEETTEE